MILTVMKAMPQDEHVQDYGTWALKILIADQFTHQAKCVSLGGIEVVEAALKAFPDKEEDIYSQGTIVVEKLKAVTEGLAALWKEDHEAAGLTTPIVDLVAQATSPTFAPSAEESEATMEDGTFVEVDYHVLEREYQRYQCYGRKEQREIERAFLNYQSAAASLRLIKDENGEFDKSSKAFEVGQGLHQAHIMSNTPWHHIILTEYCPGSLAGLAQYFCPTWNKDRPQRVFGCIPMCCGERPKEERKIPRGQKSILDTINMMYTY